MNFSRIGASSQVSSLSFVLGFAALTAAVVPASSALAEETAPLAPRAASMPEAAEPTTHVRDVGMRTAGQVLVTIGATSIVAGSAVWIGYAAQDRCEFCALGGLVYGGPVVGLGVILTAIGAPLWAVGGAEVKDSDATAPKAARVDVDVQVGPSGVGVSGSF